MFVISDAGHAQLCPAAQLSSWGLACPLSSQIPQVSCPPWRQALKPGLNRVHWNRMQMDESSMQRSLNRGPWLGPYPAQSD